MSFSRSDHDPVFVLVFIFVLISNGVSVVCARVSLSASPRKGGVRAGSHTRGSHSHHEVLERTEHLLVEPNVPNELEAQWRLC
jgi:hypothetical protein